MIAANRGKFLTRSAFCGAILNWTYIFQSGQFFHWKAHSPAPRLQMIEIPTCTICAERPRTVLRRV